MHELSFLHDHGVFLRREALDAGFDDKDISSAVKHGELMRVRHGAYTASGLWAGADEYQRHRLRCHAVLATHDHQVALSHTSAIVMHGIDLWGSDLTHVHVTRLDRRASRKCHDVRYHRGELPESQIEPLASGGFMTTAARACVDHASISSVEAGLVSLDSFLNRTTEPGIAAIESVRSVENRWPGTRRLQITLRLARIGSQSVGETRMRFLCWERGLPEPELQVRVVDNDGVLVGITDFGWSERSLLGEFDGRIKYERYLRPGESAADAIFREKRREDRIRELTGYSMIRFTWPDLGARDKTAARLRQALRIR